MDEQAFRNIGSALSGITTRTTTGAFTTGTFSYTPDQLRDIINDWDAIAQVYRDSMQEAEDMRLVVGPGLEYASQSHAGVARDSGHAYRLSLEERWRYCLAQAQKFQATLDAYLGVEDRNVETINDAGPQDGI